MTTTLCLGYCILLLAKLGLVLPANLYTFYYSVHGPQYTSIGSTNATINTYIVCHSLCYNVIAIGLSSCTVDLEYVSGPLQMNSGPSIIGCSDLDDIISAHHLSKCSRAHEGTTPG